MGAEAPAITPASDAEPRARPERGRGRRPAAVLISSRLTKAERLRRRGRFPEAIAECRRTLDRAPDDPEALLLLALLLDANDRDEACAFATRAAALVGDDDPDRLAACARIIG